MSVSGPLAVHRLGGGREAEAALRSRGSEPESGGRWARAVQRLEWGLEEAEGVWPEGGAGEGRCGVLPVRAVVMGGGACLSPLRPAPPRPAHRDRYGAVSLHVTP